MKVLIAYLTPQKWRVGLMTMLLLVSIAMQATLPLIVRAFIDAVQVGAADNVLTQTALFFIGAVLVSQAIGAAATAVSAQVGWQASNALRADVTLHCLRLDLRWHHEHPPGAMIERIDGDISLLGNFFSKLVVEIIGTALLVVAVLLFCWREDTRAGVVLTLFVVAAALIMARAQKITVPAFRASRAATTTLMSFWGDAFSAVEDMNALAATPYIMGRYRVHQQAVTESGRRMTLAFRVGVVALFGLVVAIGNAIAFAIGAYLYSRNEMTLGTVFLLMSYANLIALNLSILTNQSNQWEQAAVGLGRIQELYSTPTTLAGGSTPLPPGPVTLHFENLHFTYSADSPVLRGVTFTLPAGERVGLVGRTGSGKSTLARLLFRFYDPSAGRILWNGVDIRSVPLADLRRAIGLVTQDVQLFHATIRQNLTFFDTSVSDSHLIGLLEELGLGAWLARQPAGLDTHLAGDSGLSAGEAQLLALVRLFLQEPAVIILDEPSSRLDPATETLLDRALERLLAGRTVLMIAHRPATLARATQIVELRDGTVASVALPMPTDNKGGA